MKNISLFLLICLFLYFPAAFAQRPTIELGFTAKYYGQNVPLISINVENLSQGGDTTLFYPDTLLFLDYVIGLHEYPILEENNFRVLKNFPNPFSEKTTISIFLPQADHLQINVMNLTGQFIAFFDKKLVAGNHTFVFYPGDEKQYFLSAIAGNTNKVIKMVSLNSHSCKDALLIYQGLEETTRKYKSVGSSKGFGYSYGDQLQFTGYAQTPSDITGSDVIVVVPEGNENYVFEIVEGIPCPETPSVIYEGNTYSTVQIGTQCWFKENLNVGTLVVGTQEQTNNGIFEKYCYDNLESNCDIYGGLYQWNEMMQYITMPGVQGICPVGWHLPTDEHLMALTTYLGGTNVAGGKLKESGTMHWFSPNYDATNSSGFTGFPGGFRDTYGTFLTLGTHGALWSSSEDTEANAWFRFLYYGNPNVNRNHEDKGYGFSVRCLRD